MNTRSLRDIPRLVLHDPEVLQDPIGIYNQVREESPLARLLALGLPTKWAITRFEDARSMLVDPRFQFTADSAITQDVPDAGRVHLKATMVDRDGHRRLRSAMAKLFSSARVEEFRPRIEMIVDQLLDDLPAHMSEGSIDLVRYFADPLPINVTCEFLGIPGPDWHRWRQYPGPISSGMEAQFAEIMPSILEDTRHAIDHRRVHPGDDVISVLTGTGEYQPDSVELEGLIWINVIASSTVSGLIGNAIAALITHPDQLHALRTNAVPKGTAIEELVRWCGLHVLSTPRYATEDVDLFGVTIPTGTPVVACLAAANRDPRVFEDPERLDLGRRMRGPLPHLGFAHGAHGCAGNPLGKVIIEVALTRLFERFPELDLATTSDQLTRVPDPETFRLETLPVLL